MKTNATHEIILLTGTTFAARQYSEKKSTSNIEFFTDREKLKNACWHGLLKEVIPELFAVQMPERKLYLWQVREASQFLALEMSEVPAATEKQGSIDPYLFLQEQEYN